MYSTQVTYNNCIGYGAAVTMHIRLFFMIYGANKHATHLIVSDHRRPRTLHSKHQISHRCAADFLLWFEGQAVLNSPAKVKYFLGQASPFISCSQLLIIIQKNGAKNNNYYYKTDVPLQGYLSPYSILPALLHYTNLRVPGTNTYQNKLQTLERKKTIIVLDTTNLKVTKKRTDLNSKYCKES